MKRLRRRTAVSPGGRSGDLSAILAMVLLSAAGPQAIAYEDGGPPGHTGGFGEPDCSFCHSDNRRNAPEGELELAGLPDRYEPGAQYDITILLRHPELNSGGFQMSIRTADGASAGTLVSLSERTAVGSADDRHYLQHTKDGRTTDKVGAIEWLARWIAPAPGAALRLHIAANAANDDLSALGDYIFTGERMLEAAEDQRKPLSGPLRSAAAGTVASSSSSGSLCTVTGSSRNR